MKAGKAFGLTGGFLTGRAFDARTRVLDIYRHLLDEGSKALTERLDEMYEEAQRTAGT